MAGESAKRKKRRPKGTPDNPAQSKRFIEAAKALGLDESGGAFHKAIGKLLPPKGSVGANEAMAARLLVLVGCACLLVVMLTHVAERYSIFPAMGWGLPDSPGHYLDLLSAIAGVALSATGLAMRYFSRGT
jgi:hypothetical protein